MKTGEVLVSKSCQPNDLEKINQYTRRELSPEEVYTFQMILCDNEVDRDGECFTVEALHELAKLFVGKTGIFDHDPKGENQTARIFEAHVEQDPVRFTSLGDPYTCLKAKAYMVRGEHNRSLILEIDGGIKKEVSVGCSVRSAVCSICGADRRGEGCGHVNGREYGGKRCYTILSQPDDAYEWSFVAVPSQRNAGVTKKYGGGSERSFSQLRKVFCRGEPTQLSGAEALELERQIRLMEQKATWGDHYLEELKAKVIRLAFLSGNDMDSRILSSVAEKLSHTELKAYEAYYEKKLSAQDPSGVQLAVGMSQKEEKGQEENQHFKL
ncbi:MAG: hypothetical protein ACOX60_04765 [Massiliimalia sp.]|jgi:hypothetical protein